MSRGPDEAAILANYYPLVQGYLQQQQQQQQQQQLPHEVLVTLSAFCQLRHVAENYGVVATMPAPVALFQLAYAVVQQIASSAGC